MLAATVLALLFAIVIGILVVGQFLDLQDATTELAGVIPDVFASLPTMAIVLTAFIGAVSMGGAVLLIVKSRD